MRHDLYKQLASAIPSAIKERRKDTAQRQARIENDRRGLLRMLPRLAQSAPSQAGIEQYCDSLVQYVSFSHYGVFWRINNGEERREEAKRVAAVVYPKLQKSTEQIVRFTQRCRQDGLKSSNARFARELAQLAKHLKARFAQEDRLLSAMDKVSAKTPRAERAA